LQAVTELIDGMDRRVYLFHQLQTIDYLGRRVRTTGALPILPARAMKVEDVPTCHEHAHAATEAQTQASREVTA
jgi:hypothetical protein